MEFTGAMLSNPNSRILYDEYVAFLDLFSPDMKKRLEENLNLVLYDVSKDSVFEVQGGIALAKTRSSVIFDGINKGSVGRNCLYVSLSSRPNVRLHEWWHALVVHKAPVCKKNGYYLSHGLSRVDEVELVKAKEAAKARRKYEVQMIGSGFEEGMAEVTSILALFKKNAKIMDKIYDERILKAADHFMNTGEIDSSVLPDFFQGYFKCYADIARLFIKASRNDYMMTHDFAEVLASDEGIDGMIEEPVNKPYSTYIYSAVHGDLQFQREYDDKFVKNATGLLPYEQIGQMMDGWFDTLMSSHGRLNDEQKAEMQAIVNSISRYNELKLKALAHLGYISDAKKEELIQDFEKTADIVRRTYSVGSYGSGNSMSRPRTMPVQR